MVNIELAKICTSIPILCHGNYPQVTNNMANIPGSATWLQMRCKVQVVVLPTSQHSELTWLSPNSSMCFCMPSSCFFNWEFWNKWHQVHCNSSESIKTEINFMWPTTLWNTTGILWSWSMNRGKSPAHWNTIQIAQASVQSVSVQETKTSTLSIQPLGVEAWQSLHDP